MFGDGVMVGRQIWKCTRDDVNEGHQRTLIDGMTASQYGLTPSTRFSYIYRCFILCFKREELGGEL